MENCQVTLPVVKHRQESATVGTSSKALAFGNPSNKSTEEARTSKSESKKKQKSTKKKPTKEDREPESSDDSQDTTSSTESQTSEIQSDDGNGSDSDSLDLLEHGSAGFSSDSDESMTGQNRSKTKRSSAPPRPKDVSRAKQIQERAGPDKNEDPYTATLKHPKLFRAGWQSEGVNSDLRAYIHHLDNRCTQLQQQLSHFYTMSLWPHPPLSPQPGPAPPDHGDRLTAAMVAFQRVLAGQQGDGTTSDNPRPGKQPKMSLPKKSKKTSKSDFKRVDDIWDSARYTYRLRDTAKVSVNAEYEGYAFHVRRTFDSDGKYRATYVDIKSKLLRECLQDVIGNIRSLSLVDEVPKLDPNMLFLYLEDFRSHAKALKELEPDGDSKRERKKNQIRLNDKRKQISVLIKYLDKDYAEIKKSLYPMLESGIITYDYLWALWKPNTLVYSTTYGSADDPRVFKVEISTRHQTIHRGDFYLVDGKYLEFDGKKYGHGAVLSEIPEFKGTRKIASLPTYPLRYHKNEPLLRQQLIERGKKFITLSGSHYKAYTGIAYMKDKKGCIVKFNIQQSRVMVDPATFRRVNPNYPTSSVRAKDYSSSSLSDISDDEDFCCCYTSDIDEGYEPTQVATKLINGRAGQVLIAQTVPGGKGGRQPEAQLEPLPMKAEDTDTQTETATASQVDSTPAETADESSQQPSLKFSDEDYLIASPVVLGFSFSEKQWVEFSVSRVRDIKWNDDAWDSLVLPQETKDLIQALVNSRKTHATQTIDDVIQGKGKGLVTVLHGPPGTGKTLTAEGIAELLQCPLYMASAGELSTDSRYLEVGLQKILDVCHAWGAILLLDEADVFLEQRNMQDIHRNALVSVFLRQLEYFQGILFLTTNRVETFDEAFQSRIHIALRYNGLDVKAKRTIFKMFLDRVKAYGKLAVEHFTDEELDQLSRHELNGREIKNVVGSAQDLAMTKNEELGLRHLQQVLDVHVKFGRDLRGGAGYEDAMRSYF